jgi:hypothetical protein
MIREKSNARGPALIGVLHSLVGEEGWVKTVIFWIVMEAVKGVQHRPSLAGAAQLQATGCHQSKHDNRVRSGL